MNPVLGARDGVEATSVVRTYGEPIHLLLTDVVMPGDSDPEVAENVTRCRPGIAVLYMSGYTDDAIARHGVLEEGTHLIMKPFTTASLVKEVREVLDSPPSRT